MLLHVCNIIACVWYMRYRLHRLPGWDLFSTGFGTLHLRHIHDLDDLDRGLCIRGVRLFDGALGAAVRSARLAPPFRCVL